MSTHGKPLRIRYEDEGEENPEAIPTDSAYWDYVAWCEQMKMPVGSYHARQKIQRSVSELHFS